MVTQPRIGGKFARMPIEHGTAKGFRQHERLGEPPDNGTCGCREAYNKAMRERQPGSHGRKGDCSYCPKSDVEVRRHDGVDLCKPCYQRWQTVGFDGDEPPARQPTALETAIEHRQVLEAYPAKSAAWRIGVSMETARRYQRLLQEEDRRKEAQCSDVPSR